MFHWSLDLSECDSSRWGEEKRREDPSVFCRRAIEDQDQACLLSSIWIVCDVRRHSDIEFFQKYFADCLLLVRIEASLETREKREWVFTPNIDDAESECQLDQNVHWSFIFSNNDPNAFDQQMINLTQLIVS